jgi:hypothetical protein
LRRRTPLSWTRNAFIWYRPVNVKEMEDNLRAAKAFMIWIPICAMIDALILIIILKA